MNAAADYFIRESIAHSRTLPIGESVLFLKGMLQLANEADVVTPVRAAVNHLVACDQQLELIASGQLKLSLSEPSTKKGHRK